MTSRQLDALAQEIADAGRIPGAQGDARQALQRPEEIKALAIGLAMHRPGRPAPDVAGQRVLDQLGQGRQAALQVLIVGQVATRGVGIPVERFRHGGPLAHGQAQQPGTPQPEEGPVWRYERALQTARELQRLGVFWLEEPLDRYDFAGLKRLCAEVDVLIAGGENNKGVHELRWLIEQDVYDVIQPEAMVAETMSSLRKIAALGEMRHKLVAPHHGGHHEGHHRA